MLVCCRLVMAVKEFKGKIAIKIDYDKCTGCGECVRSCPADVYEIINGKSAATKIDNCVECCICVGACPVDAIEHGSC